MPLEGAGELDLNRQKLELAPYKLSSSLSSLDEAGLKVLENIRAAAARSEVGETSEHNSWGMSQLWPR